MSLFDAINMKWDLVLIACATTLCFVGRAFNIFPLSLIANIRRKNKISFKMQVMLWFAGMRGAIAFALAMNLKTPNSPVLITTTLFIVLFTTIILGGATAPLVRKLQLVSTQTDFELVPSNEDPSLAGSHEDDSVTFEDDLGVSHDLDDGRPARAKLDDVELRSYPGKKISTVHRYWRMIDEKFMKPCFGGKPRPGYMVS